MYFLDPGTTVELIVERGVVIARTTVQDMGTGIRSVIAGILSEDLGLPADRVRVEIGRTDPVARTDVGRQPHHALRRARDRATRPACCAPNSA